MINRIILFLLSFCAFIPISLRFSYVIQSNNYRYVKSGKECFFSGVGLFVSLFIAFALHANSLVGSILCGIMLSATAVITTLLYLKKRTKFKFTARGARLYVAIVMTELLIKAITFFIEPVESAFITLLMVFCHGIIAYAVNGIIAPLERFRNRRYVVEGCQVLNKNSILKIGITGSYGKTSCKNILTELLKEKYRVIATEGNYNTPLGVLKTVNNYREELENADFSAKPIVFIAEMGAKRKGDINELCDVVKPTHGIITGVNGQHLSTFKNIEGVYSTKKELADFIETYGGTVVFNGDNFYTLKMSKSFMGDAVVAGLAKGDFVVKELSTTIKGSSFKIVYNNEVIEVSTRLLGAHNALNIVLCVALAMNLGVSKSETNEALKVIKPIEHRLSVMESGGITILDDGYNANYDGVISALNVLSSFEGRKVVYAQGIVEQGANQRKVNEEIGRELSMRADVVILSGINQKYIENGLKSSGFSGEIYIFPSLMHAQAEFKNILKRGDVLLLQNDIP